MSEVDHLFWQLAPSGMSLVSDSPDILFPPASTQLRVPATPRAPLSSPVDLPDQRDRLSVAILYPCTCPLIPDKLSNKHSKRRAFYGSEHAQEGGCKSTFNTSFGSRYMPHAGLGGLSSFSKRILSSG